MSEEIQQLREYAYTVLIPTGDGWAGCYGGGPVGKDDTKASDSIRVRQGIGIEGRITGGIVEAWDQAEALRMIHTLHDYQRIKKDKDGEPELDEKEQPVMETVPCLLRSLEARTILVGTTI